MSISIKIENFEGPFDLLLHLIKKNEMDIYDIKISEITSQYLFYLNKMQDMDLEVTSEFIVIAATLLEIKSRELLPKLEPEEEVDEENSKEELVKKLIEYNKFKEVAKILKDRENNEGILYSKRPEIIEEKKELDLKELLKNVTLLKLYNIFSELMNTYYNKQNTGNRVPKQISIDKYRIEDKMNYLQEVFINKRRAIFSEVVFSCESKIEVIVTFLAMLELIRLKKLRVVQDNNFTEIFMEGVSYSGN
ncbi:segregation/condensation protein A [Hathewaya histolytica]|uniref:Segregation and condensation protein A n=1 Tax=Hathewaya histolytica TaxID=1498 RepID=A0A4U9R9P9_HATHI|nr:segregation/condensation protein A [Hathewaya histolytica]VTQ88322.1 segregation and condensation protein A [Hathewaya histolytica]